MDLQQEERYIKDRWYFVIDTERTFGASGLLHRRRSSLHGEREIPLEGHLGFIRQRLADQRRTEAFVGG